MLDKLVKEIRVSYYNYLKTEELLAVYRSACEMFEELVRHNRRLVENEKATMDAVYNARYDLNKIESQLANARKVQKSARFPAQAFGRLSGGQLLEVCSLRPH